MKKAYSIKIQIALVSCLALAAIALIYDFQGMQSALFDTDQAKADKPNKRALRAAPVIVQRVTQQNNDMIIQAVGDGRAQKSVMLYPEVEGRIIAFDLKAGQRVETGDVLLKLDTDKAKLAIQIAENKIEEAQKKVDRSLQLRNRRVMAQANVEDAEILLSRAQLELKQVREVYEDHTLKAPFAGVVGIPKIELGDRITNTTEVITLDDRNALIVEFDVPEQHLSRLTIGQKIQAQTPNVSGRIFAGYVEEIDTRIDPTSRTVKVRAVIPNQEDILRPGMSFAVQLKITGKPYPTVPELALQWGKNESYVWRITDKKTAEKIVVNMVRRANSVILVNGPLSENDIVVIEGVHRLRNGKKVRFQDIPAPVSSSNADGLSHLSIPNTK